eukprot:3939849-Rhodomonas_salina.2
MEAVKKAGEMGMSVEVAARFKKEEPASIEAAVEEVRAAGARVIAFAGSYLNNTELRTLLRAAEARGLLGEGYAWVAPDLDMVNQAGELRGLMSGWLAVHLSLLSANMSLAFDAALKADAPRLLQLPALSIGEHVLREPQCDHYCALIYDA